MTQHDPSTAGAWKILIAWMGMMLGGINIHAALSALALVMTIIFTGLQIYKLLREIQRERKAEAKKHQSPTGPAPL